jgi:hypothetical protein
MVEGITYMEEDQAYKEIQVEGNPQSSQQAAPAQSDTAAGNTGQVNQQPQPGNTPQAQQSGSSGESQPIGIATDDNMIEEAKKHGQPSNTITDWQRVHDKGYVERITEKTEKH